MSYFTKYMSYSIDTTKYIDKMKSFCKSQGVNLDLENPKTIQDKLAWLNIYDQDDLKVKCADKIKLHEYCKEILGEDICVPIIKVYDNVDEINWDVLPQQFVIKCNHGSGMNIIVKDKSKLNIQDAKNNLNMWMKDDFAFRNGFEAHYHDIEHKIFVEEYKENDKQGLLDYKFICCNGKPIYMQIFGDRFGPNRHMNYYNMKFEVVDLERKDFKRNLINSHEKPKNFSKMKKYAKKLSKQFKFVRVDFYEINGEVYLGELTFTPGAMGFSYRNQEDNVMVGNYLKL